MALFYAMAKALSRTKENPFWEHNALKSCSPLCDLCFGVISGPSHDDREWIAAYQICLKDAGNCC